MAKRTIQEGTLKEAGLDRVLIPMPGSDRMPLPVWAMIAVAVAAGLYSLGRAVVG